MRDRMRAGRVRRLRGSWFVSRTSCSAEGRTGPRRDGRSPGPVNWPSAADRRRSPRPERPPLRRPPVPRPCGSPARSRIRSPCGRLVDLQERLLLPLGQGGIGEDDRAGLHLVPVPLRVEDAGPHVQRLGGDAQGLGDLLEHLRARLAQPALDLAQIRIGHPGGIGELPQRELGVAPLLAQVVTEIATLSDAMPPPCPTVANFCKHLLAKSVSRHGRPNGTGRKQGADRAPTGGADRARTGRQTPWNTHFFCAYLAACRAPERLGAGDQEAVMRSRRRWPQSERGARASASSRPNGVRE